MDVLANDIHGVLRLFACASAGANPMGHAIRAEGSGVECVEGLQPKSGLDVWARLYLDVSVSDIIVVFST